MGKRYIRSENRTGISFLQGGILALGILIGALLMILFYLSIPSITGGSLSLASGISIVEVSVAAISLVALLIAFGTFSEQRMMRQAGTDPVVLAYLGQREDAPTLVTFEIANVGAGAAMDVRFEFLENKETLKDDRVITDLTGEFVAIQVIRQDQRIQYNFGLSFKLIGDDPLPPISVRLTYEDIEGNEYSSVHTLDVREVSKQAAHTPIGVRQAAALEKIEQHLKKLTRHSELHAVVETQSEYEARISRRDQEMRDLLDQSKGS